MANRAVTTKGIKIELVAGMQQAPRAFEKIAIAVPTDAPEEEYLWGGMVPAMRKWTDTRTPLDMFQRKTTVVNEIFESSLKVDRFEKQDDRAGFFMRRIRDLGARAAMFEDERGLGDLIDAAESATGEFGGSYDGPTTIAFFDTTHVDPAAQFTTAQSNDLSFVAATGTSPTLAEFKAAMAAILEQLRLFKDDRGRPWHRGNPQTVFLVVPPDFEEVVLEYINSTSIDQVGGNPNITHALRGILNFAIIVNQETANVDRMVVAFPGPNAFPFILQRRLEPVLNQVTGDRSGEIDIGAFMERYDHFGVYSRLGVGYGQWRHAILAKFT